MPSIEPGKSKVLTIPIDFNKKYKLKQICG